MSPEHFFCMKYNDVYLDMFVTYYNGNYHELWNFVKYRSRKKKFQ